MCFEYIYIYLYMSTTALSHSELYSRCEVHWGRWPAGFSQIKAANRSNQIAVLLPLLCCPTAAYCPLPHHIPPPDTTWHWPAAEGPQLTLVIAAPSWQTAVTASSDKPPRSMTAASATTQTRSLPRSQTHTHTHSVERSPMLPSGAARNKWHSNRCGPTNEGHFVIVLKYHYPMVRSQTKRS